MLVGVIFVHGLGSLTPCTMQTCSLKSKKSAGLYTPIVYYGLHYCMCVRCSIHGSQLMLDVGYECCCKMLAKIARAISKQQNVPTNIHTV